MYSLKTEMRSLNTCLYCKALPAGIGWLYQWVCYRGHHVIITQLAMVGNREGYGKMSLPLQWRHNGHNGVSNHQPHHCLLNRLFGCRSNKTSKLRVTGFVREIHRGPVNSPHKWLVTRKMFPFDDVIMTTNHDIAQQTVHIIIEIMYTMRSRYIAAIFHWRTHGDTPYLAREGDAWASSVRVQSDKSFTIVIFCAVRAIVLYMTAIYREFIVYAYGKLGNISNGFHDSKPLIPICNANTPFILLHMVRLGRRYELTR